MNEYNLLRDDFDTILELSTWPGQKDPTTLIDSKVKTSFTRTYNKELQKIPLRVVNVKKLQGVKSPDENGENYEEGEVEEKGVDIKSDAMIKTNAKPKKASARTSVKTIGAVKRGAVRAQKTKLHPNQRPKRKKL